MFLYHGTNSENLIEILKSGYIDNTKFYEDTLYIDNCIEECIGRKLTNNAIYMAGDVFTVELNFDYYIKVDVNDLDKEKLFVADCSSRDEILCYGCDEEGINVINRYVKSFVTYEDYIRNNISYENPEFLYFDKINIRHYSRELIEALKDDEELKEELKELI